MPDTNKAILYVYSGGVKEVLLNESARDNCTEPYLNLKKSLEDLRYQFDWEKKREITDYEWIFFLDVSSFGRTELYRVILRRIKNFLLRRAILNVYEESVKRKLFNKMVLFIMEPASVSNDNYKIKNHKNVQTIFTWRDDYIDNIKYFKIYPPITEVFPEVDEIQFKKKKLLVNISTNKLSNHPRELYSLRVKTIKYFEENYPEDFDLYGVGWNQSKKGNAVPLFKNYRGEVNDKWDVLPHYKYCLCYENIYGENGYITEKIFDALRCKTVPIYWGAANITQYVPEDVFINRADLKSDKELAEYIISISESRYNEYRNNGDRFLQSEKFKKFLSSNYVSIIKKTLKLE